MLAPSCLCWNCYVLQSASTGRHFTLLPADQHYPELNYTQPPVLLLQEWNTFLWRAALCFVFWDCICNVPGNAGIPVMHIMLLVVQYRAVLQQQGLPAVCYQTDTPQVLQLLLQTCDPMFSGSVCPIASAPSLHVWPKHTKACQRGGHDLIRSVGSLTFFTRYPSRICCGSISLCSAAVR